MKKLIIASAICVFPVFLLGICLPLITLMSADKKNFNETVFWIYIFILAICLAVILTTVLLLQKYASKIDSLDKEEIEIYEQKVKTSSRIDGNTVLAAGWIPVAEKLPPEHEKVLVQFGDQNILIGIMDSNDQWAIFWSDGIKADDPDRPIDYWMPLPACR